MEPGDRASWQSSLPVLDYRRSDSPVHNRRCVPGKERSRESRKDVKHSARTIPRAQMRSDVGPQGLEVREWQAPAPVAELQKRNLSGTDLFTTRSGRWATTCAVARSAIAGDSSSGGTRTRPHPDDMTVEELRESFNRKIAEAKRKTSAAAETPGGNMASDSSEESGGPGAQAKQANRSVWRKRLTRLKTTACAQSAGAHFIADPAADGTNG